MKKATLIVASMAILAFASCGESDQEPTTQVIEKTETTVIEKQTPAASQEAAPAAPTQEAESDGTSISVDKDGVELSTKDGKNRTKIDLKKDGGSLEIKK